jgi:hypothetical protein
MKILFVTGDEYSAMQINDEIGIAKAYEMTKENGGKLTIDDDETYAELSIIEFGEVDPKFVEFINDKMIDYDSSKHTDFFVID